MTTSVAVPNYPEESERKVCMIAPSAHYAITAITNLAGGLQASSVVRATISTETDSPIAYLWREQRCAIAPLPSSRFCDVSSTDFAVFFADLKRCNVFLVTGCASILRATDNKDER